MKRKTWPSSRVSIRRHIFAGVVIVAFLAIGVGGWASTAEISGALIAQGSIVVELERQEGAAPDRRRGRRAAGARRRPGKGRRHPHSPRRDRDPRQSRHCHQGSYRALRAQGASRRRARRRGDLPKELAASANNPEVKEALTSERKLFELRRKTRLGQKDQLQQRVKQKSPCAEYAQRQFPFTNSRPISDRRVVNAQ